MKVGMLFCAALVVANPAQLRAQEQAVAGTESGGASLPSIGLYCPGTVSFSKIESLLSGNEAEDRYLVGPVNQFLATTDISYGPKTAVPVLKALDVEATTLAVTISAAWCGTPEAPRAAPPAQGFSPRHWTKVKVASCVTHGESSISEEWTFARRVGEPWQMHKYAGKSQEIPCPKATTSLATS